MLGIGYNAAGAILTDFFLDLALMHPKTGET